MKAQQRGFTLIELIVVIVILGILAATALPRFVNLQNDARAASMQGLAGGMRAAADLVRGKWLAAGSSGATTINIDGTNTIDLDPGGSGYPAATATGIQLALNVSAGAFSFAHAAPSTTVTPAGGPGTCSVVYNEDTGAVTVNASAATC